MLLRRLASRDRGSTLVPVIGMVAIAGILTSMIAAVSIQALSFTSLTRAGVQAQAAADAGVQFMRLQLQSGTCPSGDAIHKTYGEVYTGTGGAAELSRLGIDGAQDYFDVRVQHRGALPGLLSATGWSDGCPTGLLSSLFAWQVRIESTGYASSPGVGGLSGRDEHTVEAVHAWDLFASPTTPTSGSAIYVGGSASVNAFNVQADGPSGDIKVLNGNFGCTTNSVIEGNVLVAAGNAHITNTCEITGSLLVSGSVSITSNVHVHGDVVAAGGSVTLSNSTIIVGGSVRANGDATIHGDIGGDLDATGAVSLVAGSSVAGSVRGGGQLNIRGAVGGSVSSPSTAIATVHPTEASIAGSLTIGGDLDTWGYQWNVPSAGASDNEKGVYHLTVTRGSVGSISYGNPSSSVPPAPPAPVVPPWVDFSYDLLDWEGYTPLIWVGDCQVGSWNLLLQVTHGLIKAATSPVIVDTRLCPTLTFNQQDIVVKTDVVFIGRGFTLTNGSSVRSGDGEAHKVWFLIPDGNPASAGPHCSGGAGNFSTNGGPRVHEPIAAFVYTPCSIQLNNGTQWRGQLYSSSLNVSSGDSLTYVQMGIPGLDLDTGGDTGGGGVVQLGGIGDLDYYRDVTG